MRRNKYSSIKEKQPRERRKNSIENKKGNSVEKWQKVIGESSIEKEESSVKKDKKGWKR